MFCILNAKQIAHLHFGGIDMNSQQAKDLMLNYEWKEGEYFPIVEGPYRYRVMVHCSLLGRQKAMFANGEHSYFCYKLCNSCKKIQYA